jgi:sulfide:quinone oxidoreductase
MAKILILGGGFAALTAAEELGRMVGDQHEITLISENPRFLFYPALVPFVFGDFRLEEIEFDLETALKPFNIRFVHGRVTGIGTVSKTVVVAAGGFTESLHYDYMLFCVGRRLAMGAVPGSGEHSHHLLNLNEALRLRSSIDSFERGSIVVALAPESSLPVPVCELSLGLAKRFNREIADGSISVTAVFPSTVDKAFAGSTLFRDIESEFRRKGIRLVSDFPIERVDAKSVFTADGRSLNHSLLILFPPFKGQRSLLHLAPFSDEAGFVKVNSRMQVEGCEGTYAAGDAITLPGPRFGYMAIRQGRVAAANLVSELNGEPPREEYRHDIAWAIGEKYTDPVYFHYGFWDNTLADFDDGVFFGLAKRLRERYGLIKDEPQPMAQSGE